MEEIDILGGRVGKPIMFLKKQRSRGFSYFLEATVPKEHWGGP